MFQQNFKKSDEKEEGKLDYCYSSLSLAIATSSFTHATAIGVPPLVPTQLIEGTGIF